MIENISTIADVEIFAAHIKEELGQGFHPDDFFEDYIDLKTGEAVYTPEQARVRNDLTDQAFAVCASENADIYAITGRIIVRGTPREGMFD
jgi:hypothetical protein